MNWIKNNGMGVVISCILAVLGWILVENYTMQKEWNKEVRDENKAFREVYMQTAADVTQLRIDVSTWTLQMQTQNKHITNLDNEHKSDMLIVQDRLKTNEHEILALQYN